MANAMNNVFIGRIHEDDTQLREQPLYERRFHPEYIKSEVLAPSIQWAGTLVVLVASHPIPTQ
jgi:hypothetical protein